MTITETTRIEIDTLKSVIREPFAWPGGYERYLITSDGGVICHACAKENYWNMLHSTRGDYRDGWQVAGQGSAADTDSLTVCDNCNKTIIDDWENS